MSKRLRSARVLRVMLVGLMVPLIVMASGNAARASEALASNVLTIKTDANFAGVPKVMSDPDCLIQVDATDGGLRIHTGYCEVGISPEPGCEILQPECTDMSVQYRGAGGCVLSQPVYLDRFDDGWFTNRVYVTSPERALGGCHVEQVCLVIDSEVSWWPDATFTGCQALGMAPPVDQMEDATCPTGAFVSYEHSEVRVDYPAGSSVNHSYGFDGVFGYRINSGENGSLWHTYHVLKHKVSGAYNREWKSSTATGTLVMNERFVQTGQTSFHAYQPPPADHEMVGVGFVKLPSNWSGLQNMPRTPANQVGLLGVNDPGQCRFYFGEKTWDDGADGGPDEPAGPLPTPYEPEVDNTLPDDLDVIGAPADEKGFWGGALDILKRLLNAIKDVGKAIGGLVKGIVDGIIDGFKGLFIPDEFPDWSSLSVDLPAGWVPELPELGSGACGPMNVPKMDFGMAGKVEGYPFVDTCEAPWTHVRTVTYFGLMALALIVVAKRIFNAALGGVGMSVEGGSGGGDDL